MQSLIIVVPPLCVQALTSTVHAVFDDRGASHLLAGPYQFMQSLMIVVPSLCLQAITSSCSL